MSRWDRWPTEWRRGMRSVDCPGESRMRENLMSSLGRGSRKRGESHRACSLLHYRAINQYGQVIDVLVSQKRDLPATRWFFARALEHGTRPTEVATDRAPAYPRHPQPKMESRAWRRAAPAARPAAGADSTR